MKQLFLFLCTLWALTAHTQPSVFDKAKLDSLLQHIAAHNKGMFSLSIFQDGQEVYRSSVGYAQLEAQSKAHAETAYGIGSVSKTFTAVLTLQLIEAGKLRLDTPLSIFFPSLPNADAITIEHLLRHRSGIFNITNEADYEVWRKKNMSQEAMLRKIAAHPPRFTPGEAFEYSNSNYILLSYIKEKVTQKSLQQALEEQICKPCGLTHTFLDRTFYPQEQRAASYHMQRGAWVRVEETHPSVPLGAGGLYATPTDLNRFLHCLFEGKLLADSSLQHMLTLQDHYGMGITAFPFYEKKAYGHTGGIDGFQSIAAYFPAEKVAVAFTANALDMSMNDILIGVLSIYFGRPYPFPVFRPKVEVKENVLRTYTGTYASAQLPLKLTVFLKEGTLHAQATGQAAFPLEAIAENVFVFEAAKVEIEFTTDGKKLILRQHGGEYVFLKENNSAE